MKRNARRLDSDVSSTIFSSLYAVFGLLLSKDEKKILLSVGRWLVQLTNKTNKTNNMASVSVKQNQVARLDQKIREKRLVDVHTHLLGMGDHSFWIGLMKQMSARPEDFPPWCYPGAVEFSAISRSQREETIRDRISLICGAIGKKESEFREVHFGDETTLGHNALSLDELRKLAVALKTMGPADRDLLFFQSKQGPALSDQLFAEEPIYSKKQLNDAMIGPHVASRSLAPTVKALKEMLRTLDQFKEWLVFDSRKQKFTVVRGIPNSDLLGFFVLDDRQPLLQNAFTMLEPEWQPFTPHFYPRRFALKDAMYEHSLVVLTKLLQHVLRDYADSGVCRIEFSIGYQDVTLRPWVFNWLTNVSNEYLVSTREQEQPTTNVSNESTREKEQPTKYRLLAGLQRGKLQLLPDESVKQWAPRDAADILAYHGFCLSCKAFVPDFARQMYQAPLTWIEKMRSAFEQDSDKMQPHHGKLIKWVVGLDWFGDEVGLPYCPFWMEEFLDFAKARMESYATINTPHTRVFGLRPHMGEVSEGSYRYYLQDEVRSQEAYRHHQQILTTFVEKWRQIQMETVGILPDRLRLGHGVCAMTAEFYANEQNREGFFAPLMEVNLTSNERLIPGITLSNHLMRTIPVYPSSWHRRQWSDSSAMFLQQKTPLCCRRVLQCNIGRIDRGTRILDRICSQCTVFPRIHPNRHLFEVIRKKKTKHRC